MRPKGLLTVARVLGSAGDIVSAEKAAQYGWIKPVRGNYAEWNLGPDEIPLGKNLFLDQGRQANAYAFGLKNPIENFVCQKVGFGTGTAAPNIAQTSLITRIPVNSADPVDDWVYTKEIAGVDWPGPFIARVEFSIGFAECNGFLITEMGLFTGDDTLVARKVNSVGINKSSDFSPILTWRVRF